MTSLTGYVRGSARAVKNGATAVLDRFGPAESVQRRSRQAGEYWSDSADPAWQSNSHWRDSLGTDEKWLAIGREHLALFDVFAKALSFDRPLRRVVEWGAGGGANATHFAPRAKEFVAVDISVDSVEECRRQVTRVCDTEFTGVVSEISAPERVIADIGDGSCDLFLCFYVLELVPSTEQALEIVRVAGRLLDTGGLAVIQTKYRTADRRTESRRRGYRRNLANMTTFGIDEFWIASAVNGLVPRLITLVPHNELDERYAYYALVKAV